MKEISSYISSPSLHDRLRTLADEYSVSVELLVSIAVKRLLDDVELLRNLRAGNIKPIEAHQNEKR